MRAKAIGEFGWMYGCVSACGAVRMMLWSFVSLHRGLRARRSPSANREMDCARAISEAFKCSKRGVATMVSRAETVLLYVALVLPQRLIPRLGRLGSKAFFQPAPCLL